LVAQYSIVGDKTKFDVVGIRSGNEQGPQVYKLVALVLKPTVGFEPTTPALRMCLGYIPTLSTISINIVSFGKNLDFMSSQFPRLYTESTIIHCFGYRMATVDHACAHAWHQQLQWLNSSAPIHTDADRGHRRCHHFLNAKLGADLDAAVNVGHRQSGKLSGLNGAKLFSEIRLDGNRPALSPCSGVLVGITSSRR
jgi:hypothetical protein